MKKFLLILIASFLSIWMMGQSTLIGSSNGGGFDQGSDFTSNSWFLVNGTATATQNQWYLGTAATAGIGSGNVAYITNNTATGAYAYTNNSAMYIVHFYRDVTFPAGETKITMSFNWKGVGETTAYDGLQVALAPTSVTPTASSTAPSGSVSGTIVAGATYVGNVLYYNQSIGTTATFNIPASVAGNSVTNSTMRVIFTFRMDGSVGTSPATAIDNISLTSAAPNPLNGSYSINNTLPTTSPMVHDGTGNFNNFTDAINYLNADGITATVTFNVVAGQTFNEKPPAITASGTAINTITFQKSGILANPKITPVGNTSSSPYDWGFCISGGDYITFDGIDVDASAATSTLTAIEYGYLIRNASATNGAQYNTIKNCSITLNKNYVATSLSGCIYSSVSTSQGGVVPTNATGANSYNKFYTLTLQNAQNGVYLVGNSSYPDLSCEVGVAGTGCQTARNTITNMGGVYTFTAAYGVYTSGLNGVKVFNNDIYNIRSNQSTTAGILIATYLGTSEVYNNKVSDISNSGSTTSTSRAAGIEVQNSSGTPTIRVYNNFIWDIKSPFTGTATSSFYAYGIYVNNTSVATVAEIDNNSVYINVPGTPTYSLTCFAIANSSTAVQRVRGNLFVNAVGAQGATAKHVCWYSVSATAIGGAGSVSNYNDLYVINDIGTSGHVGRGSTTNYNTLANWTTATTQDANSTSIDPGFSSAVNLHASASGVNAYPGFIPQAWVVTDIDCEDRSATTPHDLGADAFNLNLIDMGATALVAPIATGCYGNAETVTVTINNYGTALIDFSINPVTVTTNVTGAVTLTLNQSITSGTLASGASTPFSYLTTLNMTTAGTYTFNAFTTVTGDGNAGNDAMTPVNRIVVAPVSLPQSVDFTGFTGSNLTTVFPNWYEATGATLPSGITSIWTNASGWTPSNTSAKINLYTTTRQEWIVGPKFIATANSKLDYKIAITDFGAYTADLSGGMQGTDDRVVVRLSTNCGNSFFDIFTHNAANTGSVSNSFVAQQIDLSSYAGYECIVAFWATDGPTDDLPDYDFHIDDVSVANILPCAGAFGGTAAVTGNSTFCGPGTPVINASGYSTGTGSGYQWEYSNDNFVSDIHDFVGQSNPAALITGVVNSTTYYRLKVTCTSGQAIDYSNVITITINSVPTVTVNPTSGWYCGSGSVTLTASGADTYLWSPATGLNTTTGETVIASPIVTTTYTVTGTITATSCFNTANVTITVYPAAPTTTSVTIPQGGSGELTASATCSGYVNSGTTISGAWTAATDPIALRPTTSISNSAICSFDLSITRNYVKIDFQVSTTGNYTFEMNDNASFDGMGYIVTGAFVPGNCSGGGTWIKGDDDGGSGNEPLMTATLTAGITYTLISTTYGSTGTYSGAFGWTITPPSSGQIMLYVSGTLDWYTVATGGTAIGTGSPFNPVGVPGSGLPNTDTPGTYTFYAGCSNNPLCRTAADFIIIVPPVTATWTGNVNNDWSLAGNWNPTYPVSTTDVIIPAGLTNYPTLSVAGTCNDIFLGSTAAGAATLLDNGNLTVTGTATVQRYFSGNDPDYHLVSSPISNATANVFFDMYLMSFNSLPSAPYGPPNFGYTDITLPATGLNVMEGYALYSDLAAANTASFVGTLNLGNQTHSFNLNANNPDGWNLLGNPYPSSIDWNLVTIPAEMNGEVHYIEASTGADIAYVLGGGGGGRYVPPMQGFFISALNPGSLQFTDAVRTHLGAGSFYKYEINDLLVLKASGNGYTNETRIYFNQEATNEHDRLFDAYKIITSSNPQLPQIYSVTPNGVKLGINGLPEVNSVPVGLTVSGGVGEYTITATEISEFAVVILEDLLTGDITDLKSNFYTFNYDMNLDNRFIVHFAPLAVGENPADLINIYSSQKDVYVSVPANTNGDIVVYNLMGQEVARTMITDVLNKVTLDKSAYYVVKVMSNESVVTKKVFVK